MKLCSSGHSWKLANKELIKILLFRLAASGGGSKKTRRVVDE